MTHELLIRPESPADADAITTVTVAAFQPLEISQHTEQFIVRALRAAGVPQSPWVQRRYGVSMKWFFAASIRRLASAAFPKLADCLQSGSRRRSFQ